MSVVRVTGILTSVGVDRTVTESRGHKVSAGTQVSDGAARRALQEQWANSEVLSDRMSLAKALDAPADLLARLARDPLPTVRREVAGNPNTAPEVLERLGLDEGPFVRWYVALNTNTPVPTLIRLATDDVLLVRAAVGKSVRVPVEVLATLAQDEEVHVRGLVAGNWRTPLPLIITLSHDPVLSVRQASATNPRLPLDEHRRLLFADTATVRAVAARHVPVRVALPAFTAASGRGHTAARRALAAAGRCESGQELTDTILAVTGPEGVLARARLAEVTEDFAVLTVLAADPAAPVHDVARWRLLQMS